MMKRLIYRLITEHDGQDLIEYALLCAVLAVGCIAGILELTQILSFFARVGAELASAI